MSDQEKKMLEQNYGATMRLGAWDCILNSKSLAHKAYGLDKISERHRHRFEFNNNYRTELESAGLRIAGTSPDGHLVEIAEVIDHPWMLGVQIHPEFKSRPLRAHPLFRDFIKASIKKAVK
jgi:CTP synthase